MQAPPRTLRPATPADAPMVAQVYNHYILAGGHTMDQEPKTPAYFRQLMAALTEREQMLVLEQDGKTLGWGIIKRYSERLGYRYACETAVYLAPEHTGQGHGGWFKQQLLLRCAQLGYRHVVAKILATNTASIQYNLKLGYTVVGTQKAIGWVNGDWMDVVILQYIIPQNPAH